MSYFEGTKIYQLEFQEEQLAAYREGRKILEDLKLGNFTSTIFVTYAKLKQLKHPHLQKIIDAYGNLDKWSWCSP